MFQPLENSVGRLSLEEGGLSFIAGRDVLHDGIPELLGASMGVWADQPLGELTKPLSTVRNGRLATSGSCRRLVKRNQWQTRSGWGNRGSRAQR